MCAGSQHSLLISVKYQTWMRRRIQMLRSPFNAHRSLKWAAALRREMQIAIGQQLRVEWELPRELPPEMRTLLANQDKEQDPYADIIGTC